MCEYNWIPYNVLHVIIVKFVHCLIGWFLFSTNGEVCRKVFQIWLFLPYFSFRLFLWKVIEINNNSLFLLKWFCMTQIQNWEKHATAKSILIMTIHVLMIHMLLYTTLSTLNKTRNLMILFRKYFFYCSNIINS